MSVQQQLMKLARSGGKYRIKNFDYLKETRQRKHVLDSKEKFITAFQNAGLTKKYALEKWAEEEKDPDNNTLRSLVERYYKKEGIPKNKKFIEKLHVKRAPSGKANPWFEFIAQMKANQATSYEKYKNDNPNVERPYAQYIKYIATSYVSPVVEKVYKPLKSGLPRKPPVRKPKVASGGRVRRVVKKKPTKKKVGSGVRVRRVAKKKVVKRVK